MEAPAAAHWLARAAIYALPARYEPFGLSILEAGLAGWWERYRRFREERRRRPHTPGVWVVYFSLAALPLYGLGQSLIPAYDESRRRYVFWLMTVYVASGLGLLLTTCFLGLRRYLRQRKLQMPMKMTGTWLAIGGALIAVLLLLGAFLPRPHAEYPLVDLGAPLDVGLAWRRGTARPTLVDPFITVAREQPNNRRLSI